MASVSVVKITPDGWNNVNINNKKANVNSG